MKVSTSTNSQTSVRPPAPEDTGLSPWQKFKSRRILCLTLPLLIMATITEFVILATAWKYQQMVCLPSGMGVTFFGIGPIGATILAVELLKLPLAVWTASRRGWQKGAMLIIGLPLICLLTFQLVKDMAVYEMGVAMTPASQVLEKAMAEETRIARLNGELAAIEQKKADREQKLAELSAKQAQAKASLEDLLLHNNVSRTDAINLTDYQKGELSEAKARESTLIQQFNADAEQVNKGLAEARERRETELTRAGKWNAEEARIENGYKAKLADYTNRKTAYEKDRAEYDNANFLRRKFMTEPVDPGVAPERQTNTLLKPAALAEIEQQIKAREAELQQIHAKRRDRLAQVEADARQVRVEFDQRSSAKRADADRKRDELLAAQAALVTEWKSEKKEIDQELAASVQKVDGIRSELDAARKRAAEHYEAREAAIRNTQVHRIATTVEIVRGWIMGERPASIKSTAKERGDIFTDQISMVRIWVYPVLAFIVAFLPTLLVEVGFTSVFHREQQRPPYRLGFFGRRLHWLYTRAGRQKILRAERLAGEASAELGRRDRALAAARTAAGQEMVEKESELQAAREALAAAAARHQEQARKKEQEHAAQLKSQEVEWVAKVAGMADSLNRSIIEKDALRDLQKSEIERQIQMRQNAWSERLTQLRQELDEQRNAFEKERAAMQQVHHQKLLEVSEDSKAQVIQARRQAVDAEFNTRETLTRLTNDLAEASQARDLAESRLQQQAEAFAHQLSETREDASREFEKALRQEKQRGERQQMEFTKTLRQREEEFEHLAKQREQELSLAAAARLTEHQTRIEQEARRREVELARQFEARAAEAEARWKQDSQKREEGAETRLKQREEELQAQTEVRLAETKTQAEQELRRLRSELERQFEAKVGETGTRLKHELQQRELAFQAQLRQREQDSSLAAEARETQIQNQWRADVRAREEEWERQAGSRVRAVETRLAHEVQQREELVRQFEVRAAEAEARWKQDAQKREEGSEAKLKQREEELQVQAEVRLAGMQTQAEQELRRLKSELERQFEAKLGESGARLKHELQQRELAFQAQLRQREQDSSLAAEARETEVRNQWRADVKAREEEWARQAESRVRGVETRFAHEAQQKEDLFLAKSRQSDQQWQAKLDTAVAGLSAQTDEILRDRQAAAEMSLRELGAQLRKEMRQKDEAAQAKARQREQELEAQLTARADARQMDAHAQWEKESAEKLRATIDPLKALLARAVKERDEAKQSLSDRARQVQALEKKLTEASMFFSSWRDGNNGNGNGNGNGHANHLLGVA
jgi:hypothetical protein